MRFWEDVIGFPKQSFCKLESPNTELDKNLFHAKVLVTTDNEKGEITDASTIYIGSHNFSASAWGNLEKNRT